jgi:PleD family two-component response regulator
MKVIQCENRDALLRAFDEACAKTRSTAEDAWKKVDIARGMAVYDPGEDNAVDDVARRADKLMYENKWSVKGMKTER